MAGGIEILTIIGVVVVGAITLPLLLNENSGAFLENSLCVILDGVGQNVTCNEIKGNVTFVGLNGIDVFTNFTANTVFWNFTGDPNATGDIHQNLDGDAFIFKNKTLDTVYLRGLTAGSNITITQRDNDILIESTGGGGGNFTGNFTQTQLLNTTVGDAFIFKNQTDDEAYFRGVTAGIGMNVTQQQEDVLFALKDCNDKELLIYNQTTMNFECITLPNFAKESGLDNEAFFPAHLSAGGGDDVVVTYSDYDLRSIRFRDTLDSFATWAFQVPKNYVVDDILFVLYWSIQTTGTGQACHDISIQAIEANETLDFTFPSRQTQCFTPTAIDTLYVSEYVINATTHGVTTGDDLTYLQLSRQAGSNPAGPTGDDLNRDTFVIGGKLRWLGQN